MSDLLLFNSEKAEKLSSEEVLEQLKSSLAGLSDREAKERLTRFGPNAVKRMWKSGCVMPFMPPLSTGLMWKKHEGV